MFENEKTQEKENNDFVASSKQNQKVDEKITMSDSEWPEIIDLFEYTLPDFPVNKLPRPFSDFMENIAESLRVPVDMPAILALTACSYCLSGSNEIMAKADWIEPLNLYTVVLMPSSNKKTPVTKIICEPLYSYEKKLIQESKPKISEYITKKESLEDRKNLLRKQFSKNPNQSELSEKLSEINSKLNELKPEYTPVVLFNDSTPEAIVQLLKQGGGKLAAICSEGSILNIITGRYSDKLNCDIFLNCFSGAEPIKVHRKGQEALYVEKGLITIGLAVQQELIDSLRFKNILYGNGFLNRFLFSSPNLRTDQCVDTVPISKDLSNYYSNLIFQLLDIKNIRLNLSCSANRIFVNFADPHYAEINNSLKSVGPWAGKLLGSILRIAGVMQFIKKQDSTEVDDETIAGSIEIGKYFIPHAKSFFLYNG